MLKFFALIKVISHSTITNLLSTIFLPFLKNGSSLAPVFSFTFFMFCMPQALAIVSAVFSSTGFSKKLAIFFTSLNKSFENTLMTYLTLLVSTLLKWFNDIAFVCLLCGLL